MPPVKGKQGTRGQKQILQENKQTIKFYTIMSTGAWVIYFGVFYQFFWEQFSMKYLFILTATATLYASSVGCMKYMAKASYSETGALIDGGIDLNMEKGFAEYLKDLVILTASLQVLSLISNYVWYGWLFVPGYAFYLLWANVLGPWFFQPAPEVEEQVDEKKQRKFERRQKRMQ